MYQFYWFGTDEAIIPFCKKKYGEGNSIWFTERQGEAIVMVADKDIKDSELPEMAIDYCAFVWKKLYPSERNAIRYKLL